jgi:hypothetical protein
MQHRVMERARAVRAPARTIAAVTLLGLAASRRVCAAADVDLTGRHLALQPRGHGPGQREDRERAVEDLVAALVAAKIRSAPRSRHGPFGSPQAAVLCKQRSGVVVARDTWRRKETALDLAAFGLLGPA